MATDPIEQVLAELRQLAVDMAPITPHLAAIDAQLAELPSSAEVEALRDTVHGLQRDMSEVMSFIHGDPPLKERLIALEENVAKFKAATGVSEADIRKTAGTASDAEHKDVIRGETEPQFKHAEDERAVIRVEARESEARSSVQVGGLRDRLDELIPAIKEIQGTTLLLMTVGALIAAVALFVAVRALGF